MKIGELEKLIPDLIDIPLVIEFPDTGGPFRTPGDFHFISGTEDIAIEADYPRRPTDCGSFASALRDHDQDGTAQLYLSGPPQSWYDISTVREHKGKNPRVVIVAGAVRATT